MLPYKFKAFVVIFIVQLKKSYLCQWLIKTGGVFKGDSEFRSTSFATTESDFVLIHWRLFTSNKILGKVDWRNIHVCRFHQVPTYSSRWPWEKEKRMKIVISHNVFKSLLATWGNIIISFIFQTWRTSNVCNCVLITRPRSCGLIGICLALHNSL